MNKLEETFWHNVQITDDCWLWNGNTDSHWHGTLWMDGKNYYAHRFSYELAFGTIPEGLYCCHHCDNRRCVNPQHLFVGTCADNLRDAAKKERMPRHPNSKLNENQVSDIRTTYKSGLATQKELAIHYGVEKSLISKIVNYRIWVKSLST